MEADQEIRGEVMNAETAAHLGRAPGAVALCALRRYTSRHGTLITSSTGTWPRISARMKLLKNI